MIIVLSMPDDHEVARACQGLIKPCEAGEGAAVTGGEGLPALQVRDGPFDRGSQRAPEEHSSRGRGHPDHWCCHVVGGGLG